MKDKKYFETELQETQNEIAAKEDELKELKAREKDLQNELMKMED